MFKIKKGFTLAEMMVVMLILSIVLAAMAPVITTRSKTDQSSPWKYTEGNLSDAYYGLGDSQTAMIGQREFSDIDETAKLIINSSDIRPSQIAFKHKNTNQGVLRLINQGLLLGTMSNDGSINNGSVAIGKTVKAGDSSVAIGSGTDATGRGATAIGNLSKATGTWSTSVGGSTVSGNYSTGVGNTTVTGEYSTAVGNNISTANDYTTAVGHSAKAESDYATAVGYETVASGSNSTAIGYKARSTGENSIAISVGIDDRGATGSQSIAIGHASNAGADNTTSLGTSARATAEGATALGYNTDASGTNSLSIGNAAATEASNAIVIGPNAYVQRHGGIAIGNNAHSGATDSTLYGDYAIAIGQDSKAGSDDSISIGYQAGTTNKGSNVIAIGSHACQYVSGSNKICIGNNSGPNSNDSGNTDSVERIYIGSQSKYDKGSAVLEVHNSSSSGSLFPDLTDNLTSVIIHGNLIVTGRIATRFYDTDDLKTFGRYNRYVHHYDINDDLLNNYVQSTSDRRLKYVGKENSSGLDKIRQLKVFNYTYKKDDNKEPHVGVIAQDLQKVFPDAVKKGKDGFLTIRMEDMFYAVINAVKELDARVTALEKENAELKARLDRLEAKIK